jgi:hypothetical protein
LQLRSSISLKTCGYAVVEVLLSPSCGIALVEKKICQPKFFLSISNFGRKIKSAAYPI